MTGDEVIDALYEAVTDRELTVLDDIMRRAGLRVDEWEVPDDGPERDEWDQLVEDWIRDHVVGDPSWAEMAAAEGYATDRMRGTR